MSNYPLTLLFFANRVSLNVVSFDEGLSSNRFILCELRPSPRPAAQPRGETQPRQKNTYRAAVGLASAITPAESNIRLIQRPLFCPPT
jgi:hypothetical protein